MTASEVQRSTSVEAPANPPAASTTGFAQGATAAFAAGRTAGFATGRALRPSTKVLPEHARGHNRSLVLQTLYRGGLQSRADLARETGLTRVTVSDLVAELIADGLVIETDHKGAARP